jgi:F-type H+-transporting ATPase subunit alpha
MTDIKIDTRAIATALENSARNFSIKLGLEETGRVIQAGDGIVRLEGLPGVMAEEMILFKDDVYGMAMNLDRYEVGAVVLGDYTHIEQGDAVKRTGKVLEVPVGEALLGRVVNPLGMPLDGKGPIATSHMRRVETNAPGIIDRQPVNVPLQTGLKSIDAMTAIGRGQRELIIGDRQTGKTTVAIDTILNQKKGDVSCVYVAIGQKMSTVATLVELLALKGALENCIIVVAAASDPAPLQYIAPFAGCTMAEYFRDLGKDALVVYDDLSKHAVAYREISLVLRRPPGREAYPGDIFYLHSRLLERASKFSAEKGGGTLTALPIVETQEGDYSAYIPTNLISITDGQIYLQSDLFHQGFRPAINVGVSVSRVGGKAQLSAIRKVAIKLRLELAQYREVAAFAQLTSDLDPATMRQLHRGERLEEVLKQEKNEPMSVEKEVCILWAASTGHLDDLPLNDITMFQVDWFALLDKSYQEVGRQILATGKLSDDNERDLEKSVAELKKTFVSSGPVGTMDFKRVVPRADEETELLPEAVVKTA